MADVTRNVTVNVKVEGDTRAINALASLERAEAAVIRASTAQAKAITASSTATKAANDNNRAFAAGLQNVGYQVQDTAVQIAGGTSAVRAFSQQLPQAIGAMSTMFKEGSKLAAFFGGPWGVGLGVAAAVLIPLIDNLFNTRAAAEEAQDALQNLSSAGLAQLQINLNKLRDARLSAPTGTRAAIQQNAAREKEIADLEQQERWYKAGLAAMENADKQREKSTRTTQKNTAAIKANNEAEAERIRLQNMGLDKSPGYYRDQQNAADANGFTSLERFASTDYGNNAAARADEAAKAYAKADTELTKYNATIKESGLLNSQAFSSATTDAVNSISSAFESAAEGTKSFSDAFEEMGRQVIAILVKIAIQYAVIKALGGGSSLGGALSKMWGFAKGGAFDQGKVIPFAKGGVVTRPTVFPMAQGMGLMGEAGPEAVMPLKRDGQGNLGVSAPAPTINIYNNSAAAVDVQSDGDQINVYIEAARRAVATDIRRGDGVVSAAMQGTYRLARGQRS